MKPSLTGLIYWPLIHPYKDKLKARVPLSAKLIDSDTDALIVAIGSGSPYRLLVVYTEANGLIRIKLWECGRRLRETFDQSCLSDLVSNQLDKVVRLIES